MTSLAKLVIGTSVSPSGLPTTGANEASIATILSIVFGIIGALALLMVVLSGLRYITSDGDPQKASTAKSGIIYALVGLAVAVLAQSIVVFVIRRLT